MTTPDDVTVHQLAVDVIALAQAGGMPDTFWATDTRIARACRVLGLTPAHARSVDVATLR